MENKKKKRYGIIAALLLLVLAAGVGTYAWLTAQSSLTNNFTTAGINKPTTVPTIRISRFRMITIRSTAT